MKIRVTVPVAVGLGRFAEEGLGLALEWTTELVVDPSTPAAIVDGIPEIFDRFLGATGKKVPAAGMTVTRRAPLVEEASVIVGVLLAADSLCDTGLSRMKILQMAASHGGRMDAVAACLYGGAVLTVARQGTPTVVPLRVPASWKVVLRGSASHREDVPVGLAAAAIAQERPDLLAAAFGPESKGIALVSGPEAGAVAIASQGARVEPLI